MAHVLRHVRGGKTPSMADTATRCGKPLLVSQPQDQQDSKPVAQLPPVGPKPAIPPMEYSPAQPGTASAVADRLEIKPKTGRNVLLLVLGCSFFTLAGLFMMSTGEPQNVGAGLLSVAFFGGGGLIMGPRLLRRKVSMVLTREGMEQITPNGKAYISWRDVEKLGLVSLYANKMVGIRLLNYDAYVQSMSPEMTEFLRKGLPCMKLLARGASLLSVPDACQLWSKLEGDPDPKDALKRPLAKSAPTSKPCSGPGNNTGMTPYSPGRQGPQRVGLAGSAASLSRQSMKPGPLVTLLG